MSAEIGGPAPNTGNPPPVEKVTAFIIRPGVGGPELLLFTHPFAGIQIPAGTVEASETPEQAAQREAAEESGLTGLTIRQRLGVHEERLPPGEGILAGRTRLHVRPDPTSASLDSLNRGLPVQIVRRQAGFTQVRYEEFDRIPDPQYTTLLLLGWVPDSSLAERRRRYFYLLDFFGDSPQRWTVTTDHHVFSPFWASIASLPAIIPPQDEWLVYLRQVYPNMILASSEEENNSDASTS